MTRSSASSIPLEAMMAEIKRPSRGTIRVSLTIDSGIKRADLVWVRWSLYAMRWRVEDMQEVERGARKSTWFSLSTVVQRDQIPTPPHLHLKGARRVDEVSCRMSFCCCCCPNHTFPLDALIFLPSSTTESKMARQAKLAADYFKASPSGSGDRSQSQKKKQGGRFMRHQSDSEEADGFAGYGSEGSAGMAAIRLSRSPSKVSANSKSTKAKAKEAISKAYKAPSSNVNLEDEDSDYIRSISPVKLTQGTSRDAEEDVEDLIGSGRPSPATKRPSTSKGKEKEGSDEDVLVLSTTLPSQPALKRVPLGSSSARRDKPPAIVPVPDTYTRLKKNKAQERERGNSVATSTSPSPSPSPSHHTQRPQRSFPYVELEPWSASRKAKYPFYDFGRPTAVPPTSLSSRTPAVQSKSARTTLPDPIFDDIMEIREQEPGDAVTGPGPSTPTKRHRFLGVEIPTSQRSATASVRIHPSSQRQSNIPPSMSIVGQSGPTASKSTRRDFTPISGVESDDDDEAPIVKTIKPVVKKTINISQPKQKARVQTDSDEGSNNTAPVPRIPTAEKGKGKAKQVPVLGARPNKKRRLRSEERDAMLDEIKMDEPKRFASQSRLRGKKKETEFQRNLRKMKSKRAGIIEVDTESEDEGETDDGTDTSDSAVDSRSEDFIEDDGGVVAEGVLPHEFSLNSAQTPEWRFKVVFHYFVVLAVRGVDVLPLTGDMKDYFMPQVEDARRKMAGFRDQRVRGQLWPHDFVEALKTHPVLQVSYHTVQSRTHQS